MRERHHGAGGRVTYHLERAVMAKGKPQRTAANVRPRDAAALLIVDMSGKAPRVLMGRRHAALDFMPDVYVFPGGSVEPDDYLFAVDSNFTPPVAERAKAGLRPRGARHKARALGVAALREAYEEAGVTCCTYCALAKLAGEAPAFNSLPLEKLTMIARAITPPFQKRRYDTRFFAINARSVTVTGATDGELTDPGWLTFAEARERNMHIMTRTVLGDLESQLKYGGLEMQAPAIPFYFKRGACFQRRLI
jgi:8-oxo-dGTP pyrophosphatase MutT (NUDIX family)